MRTILLTALGFVTVAPIAIAAAADEPLAGAALAQQVAQLHKDRKYKEAAQAADAAAKAGDPVGMFLLGASHEFGWGVDRDARIAASWYEKAAASDGYAALVVGQLYARGGYYLRADKAAGDKWLAIAAQKGFRGADGEAVRHPAGAFYQAALARRLVSNEKLAATRQLDIDWMVWRESFQPSKYTPRTISEFEELRKQRERNQKLFKSPDEYPQRRIKLLAEALAADPTDALAWQARGLARWKDEHYEDNLKFDPLALTDPTAAEKAKRLATAQEELLAAAALNPGSAELHQQIVELAELRKDANTAALHRGLRAESRARQVAALTDPVDRGRQRLAIMDDQFAAGRWADLLASCDALRLDLADPAWKAHDATEPAKRLARHRGLALVALGKAQQAQEDLKAADLSELALLDFRFDRLAPDATETIALGKRRLELAPHTLDELDRAIAIFTRSIELDPKNGEAYFRRAQARQRRHEETKKVEALNSRPLPSTVANLKGLTDDLAAAEALKFNDPALSELKRAASRDYALLDLPGRIASARETADKLVAEKKLAQAAQVWQALVEKVPDRVETRLARLAFLTAYVGELGLEHHKAELDAARALLPDDPARRGQLCLDRLKIVYRLHRDYLHAEYKQYKDEVAQAVKSPAALGWTAFDCGHYADAHALLREVAAAQDLEIASRRKGLQQSLADVRGPEAIQIRRSIATFEREQADPSSLAAQLRRQVEVLGRIAAEPKDAVGLALKANALAVVGDDVQADLELLAAGTHEPKSVLIHCWAANRRTACGNYKDAEQSIAAALALNPNSAEAYICRGALRQAQCRFDAAVADFSHAMVLSRSRPEAYQRRAQVAFYQGDLEGAFTDLATALLIEPPDMPLLLPVRLARPAEGMVEKPSERIVSTGSSRAAVATAQLKLARGDLEGVEADLRAHGDRALEWRGLSQGRLRTEREPLSEFDRERAVAARRQELEAAFDWAALTTLGLARATWDEDQTLYFLRERPLADSVQTAVAEPRLELARWDFIAANSGKKLASAYAALLPSVHGPPASDIDQRRTAEYRAAQGRFRHAQAVYRRSQVRDPLPGHKQPEYNANENFALARDRVLSPACREDLYATVVRLAGELQTGKSVDASESSFKGQLQEAFDARLLGWVALLDSLPSHAYADPLRAEFDPLQDRLDALHALQASLKAAAGRMSDAGKRDEFTAAAAALGLPIRQVMASPEYQFASRQAYDRLRSAKDAAAARLALDELVALGRRGNTEACYLLGATYYAGIEHVPADGEQALQWLKKGAELGHVRSQARLGAAYYTGLYVRSSLELAALWLEKAAAAGDAEAKDNLAAVRREEEFNKTASRPAPPKPKPGPADIEAAIKSDPTNPKNYENRCLSHLLARQDELALADAEKVIELKPDDEDGYALKYIALALLGREADAQKAKEQVAKYSPSKAAKIDKDLGELKKLRGM